MPPSAATVLWKSLVGGPWSPQGGGQPPCSVLSLHGMGIGAMISRVDSPCAGTSSNMPDLQDTLQLLTDSGGQKAEHQLF